MNEVIIVYSDINGVLERANRTEFGLASGVFTKDINKVILALIVKRYFVVD